MTIDITEFNKSTCIIVDKIFTQCKCNECIHNVKIPFDSQEVKKIKFQQGFIVNSTLKIYNIENRPNFKRIVFHIRIPFNAITYDEKIHNGFLPDIKKDIVLFMPDFERDEFNFNIDIETNSQVLGDIIQSENKPCFTSKVSILVSVVGKVQLFVPYIDFCQESSICIDFDFEDDICETFHDKELPDFYPPQLPHDKKKYIRKDIRVKKVNDVIIYGQIKKCNSQEPIEGAIVKIFYTDYEGNLNDICHTFSGCNGYYMLRLPPNYEGEVITIMATRESCLDLPEPCQC